jgi:hypothetical protein
LVKDFTPLTKVAEVKTYPASRKLSLNQYKSSYTSGEQVQLIELLLVVLKPNRIIRKCTDANCSSFHLRVFLGLSNPQGQRQTSTLSIPCDNFGERKAKFNLEMSRTTQM